MSPRFSPMLQESRGSGRRQVSPSSFSSPRRDTCLVRQCQKNPANRIRPWVLRADLIARNSADSCLLGFITRLCSTFFIRSVKRIGQWDGTSVGEVLVTKACGRGRLISAGFSRVPRHEERFGSRSGVSPSPGFNALS